jgi:hypothetical protein
MKRRLERLEDAVEVLRRDRYEVPDGTRLEVCLFAEEGAEVPPNRLVLDGEAAEAVHEFYDENDLPKPTLEEADDDAEPG